MTRTWSLHRWRIWKEGRVRRARRRRSEEDDEGEEVLRGGGGEGRG